MRSKIFLGILCCCLLLSSCEFILKEPAEGKINYLVIGESYSASNYSINKLNYPVADATSMQITINHIATMTGRAFGKTYALIEGNSTKSDTYPTKAHTEAVLEDLKEEADDDSLTIIYYSGHGIGKEVTDIVGYPVGSLCFVKTDPVSAIDFDFMKPEDLVKAVNSIPGKKLIILDSCYSGAIADDYGVTHNTDTNVGDIWDAYFSDSQYGLTDLYMLTAASSETEALEDYPPDSPDSFQIYHGVFTYYLLKGLGWTADGEELSTPAALDSNGYVTLDSLYAYILPNAQEVYPLQHATTNGTANNLVLFKY